MADDDRPDPDRLLQQVQQDEARARRGKLKIFFGASAGVGKTYAMLAAARAAQVAGTALMVGLVETHGRAETEAMARDLPRLPLKAVPYRDRMLQEFDLDAALAWAKQHAEPLVLLDELAHSNAPGSRHPKRWQDVEELLDAGIDVWSTMNVQHLESLNDIVSGITGIRVWETVPDRLFDEADEVVVVDLPPDELLQRLKAGKVYLPQQAERAAGNFFRKGNLLALRELALRRTADRVDDEMQAYRRRSSVQIDLAQPRGAAGLRRQRRTWRQGGACLCPPGGAARGAVACRACRNPGGAPAARSAPREGAARAQAGAGAGRHRGHAGRARGRRGAGALCARTQPVAAGHRPRAAALALAAFAGRTHRRAGRRPGRDPGGAAGSAARRGRPRSRLRPPRASCPGAVMPPLWWPAC